MPKNNSSDASTDDLPYILTHKLHTLIVLSLIIFILALTMWWKYIYNSPENVFNGMLENNLQTSSITRSTDDAGSQSPQTRVERLSFVPDYSVRSSVTLEENADGMQNKVTTETIGTLKEDYSRYVNIETNQKNTEGKNLDYSSVENVWSKSDPNQEQPQYFGQATLGLIIFANLDGETRDKVLAEIKDKKAYDVDYSKVEPKRLDGKSAIVVPVKVNLEAYVSAVKIVAKQIGLGDLASLDPNSYKGQPPIELKLTIDKISRQLMQIEYVSGAQIEKYSGYGLSLPAELPTKTIPTQDLQQKVQEIQ